MTKTRATYEDIYTTAYERGYHRDPMTTVSGALIPLIRYTPGIRFDSVLDVGCSRGMVVKGFADEGKHSVGVDVSKLAVEYCRQQRLDVVQASVTDLPYNDNSFDMVITTDVLEHLYPEDVDKAVSEIVRVTGKYTGHTIYPYKDQNKRSPEYFKGFFDQPHLTRQGIQWWREKFESLGCRVILDMGINNTLVFEVPSE